MEYADMVIVGAGWHGLVMARTYQDVNTEAKIIILDSAQTIGGVWAKERLYPTCFTNNLLGTYEYSDFPMTEERFGVKPGQHVPATVVHEYLRQYAAAFDLSKLIRFGCKVESAEMRDEAGWLLTVSKYAPKEEENKEFTLRADKLVVATGIRSDPFMPEFEGIADFQAPLFHAKDLRRQTESLTSVSDVVVFGASKSAWDACYLYATRGIQVHWVIRSSGYGPAWMSPPFVTPLKLWLESLVLTRALTWFSPCIWGDADGYGCIQRFLHGTWLGRKIVAAYWFLLSNDVIELMGYNKHPETKKLRGWNHPFWGLPSTSILNYETDFMGLVRRGKINVHIADIVSLSEKTVHLSDSTSLPADSLVCATGWKFHPPIKFLPEGIDTMLGLPHYTAKANELADRADKVILDTFPGLRDQPRRNPKYMPIRSSGDPSWSKQPNQPYRLYRFLVPPSPKLLHRRSIAFPGTHHATTTPFIAQAQALWLTAYFGNKVSRLASPSSETQKEIEWETVLHSQFGKWRYPAVGGGSGERYPQIVFESLPYVDLLLKDLGLIVHRKGGWWWREWFVPYGQSDYKGLVEEWMKLQE